jgi:hypothetical protein
MQGINDLGFPTINGLKSLNLDELDTTILNANTIDGNIIYYNRIEGNEIIVDTKLTLTNTGVIAVGDKFISDIELTYLDGVSSNIQKQIDNIAGQDLQLQAQIDNHTNQINDLQISDTEQNTLLENLEASVNTYDFRIETLEINDVTQTNQITALQTSDTSQNTAITTLQSKTQNITSATTISTNMNKPLVISWNGECLKTNGAHTFWSGFDAGGTTRYFAIGKESNTSNRLMFSNYTLGETVIQAGSRSGNTNLGQNKIITNSNGISLRRGGITAGDPEVTVGEIGALTDGNLRINGTSTNNIILDSGIGAISLVSLNKINTSSTGVVFNRNVPSYYSGGEIGLLNPSINTFHIVSNGTNDIYMSSGSGTTIINSTNNINLSSNTVYIGSTTANANGRKSNILMYNSTGDNWETQSSAFTETLKSQISTNASNITILQNSNSSLNSSIIALQESDTSQNTAITNLQISDTAQNTTIAFQTTQINEFYEISDDLYIKHNTQNTQITDLQSKTQNITTATTTSTNMNKPIYVSSNEGLRMYGGHGFISSFPVSGLRDYYIGTPSTNNKKLTLQNEKVEGIYLQTGSRTGNTNLGQNKIVTYSNGIQLRRGGITINDDPIIIGEIGGINTDAHLYINGNGTNNIYVNSGLGNTNLVTNLVWIGSGTANANGRKSNINMLDATGNNWETQSSAFTETLKAQITSSSSSIIILNNKFSSAFNFGGSKGKISITRNFDIIGLSVSTLSNSTLYIGENQYNVGLGFRNTGLYNDLFDASGKFVSMEGFMNFNIIFEMEFKCRNSSLNQLLSRIIIKNDENIIITGAITLFQGYKYNTAQTFHEVVYYNVSMKHIIDYGHYIYIETPFQFTTGTQGAITAMQGKITIERQVL